MSPLLACLPSRPESAHVKPTEDIAMVATGLQNASDKSLRGPKNRRRPMPTYDFLSKPSEMPQDDIFTYFQKEADKKDGASCVFLLWGSTNPESSLTWAVDVPIAEPKNEDEIFASLATRYATELGFLQRCLSFRRFSRLRPVTFRLISRSPERFSVLAKPLDLAKLAKVYSARKENAAETTSAITTWDSNDFPDCCFRDGSGKYEHCNSECPSYHSTNSNDADCPFEEWEFCNDQLHWIETAAFLSCYFRDPASARSQDILNGIGRYCFINEYRKIFLPPEARRPQLPRPQTRYVELNGLYVETAWDPIRCLYLFLAILLCVVAGVKLVLGSWEITFGAGSFFVALAMLALTVLSYCEV